MQTQIQLGESTAYIVANQPMLFAKAELKGPAINYARNEEIFGEGEAAEYVYKVISGSVRAFRILSDGRRQIMAFYMPGDIFGVEPGDDHVISCEAISASTIVVVKRATLFKTAERDVEVARGLLAVTAAELRRSQNHALLLIKNAQERLAAFILEMADRVNRKGCVNLPMSRQDIADYLGLTIETVSRTLSQFAARSTIELVASREIVLRNRAALSDLNS
jgi:CRP/FNR family nitrogen fixation transcriptional regulator